MRTEVQAWYKAMVPSQDIDSLTAEEVANIEANYDGQQGNRIIHPKPANGDVFAEIRAERERVKGIGEIAERYLTARPDDVEAIQRLHDHAIEAKMSVQEFRCEMAETCIPPSHTVTFREKKSTIDQKVLQAAICMAGNLQGLDKQFDDRTLQTAHDKFRNGIGLKQLYRIAAKANGYNQDDDEVTMDMHRYACGVTGARSIQASGFSTISLPGILSNVANKFLQEGWEAGEMVWRNITAIRNVRDFKTSTSYKLNGWLKYAKVGPSGEITHGTLTEETYTVKADTYGRMLAVTRTDIINDDLGALTSVPRELGTGANDAFNEVFWTEFLSETTTFFASGNANVSAGTVTTTTVIATLIAAELIFLNQTKPNGQPLGMLPDRILCPPAQKRIFQSAMTSERVTGVSTGEPENNTFRGDYAVYSTPYIANAAYTGYSAAKWYLLLNPARLAVIETAFLNGRESPVIETSDAEFNVLGVQMRGYHDFGVNMQEPRAGVQGSGA